MIHQLRTYEVHEGRMADWLEVFAKIRVSQTRGGMRIVDAWTSNDDPNEFVWLRTFDSEEEMKRLCEAYYGSDEWQDNFAGPAKELIKNITSVRHLESVGAFNDS